MLKLPATCTLRGEKNAVRVAAAADGLAPSTSESSSGKGLKHNIHFFDRSHVCYYSARRADHIHTKCKILPSVI